MWQTFWGKFLIATVYGQDPIYLPWIKKTNNYYFCGIIFKMEINLPCVVIAPNKKKVYKSFIGCQERILSCRVLFHTVKPRFTLDTLSIRTPHFYGEFALSLGKQSPYNLSKFNRLNTDTPFIRTLFHGPFSVRINGVWLYFALHIVMGRWLCRVHCQHDPMNYPSFLALSFFLTVPSGWP